jgi:23S rRNA (cytidine2498-2'-O)-methyltransferase
MVLVRGLLRLTMVTSQERFISITRAGQEPFLIQELHTRSAAFQCNQVAPQVVEISSPSEQELAILPLFFSVQLLPNARTLSAQSITVWASAILDALIETFGESSPAWALHIFDPLQSETGKDYARPTRINEALRALLKQKRRSLLKTLSPVVTRDTHLVQVALLDPQRGYFSVATPKTQSLFKAAISPYPAGYVVIPEDKKPPSRAYQKLQEALKVFRLTPTRGQTAVDLGAAPGGWTYVLKQLGLHVTAIDRSPLDPSLMRGKEISFQRGNALTWLPEKPVDWLVCDVITSPENTCALVSRWITEKKCRFFCVTVKFKGAPAFDILHSLVHFLSTHTAWFDAKQLTHNKNEVTVVGRLL